MPDQLTEHRYTCHNEQRNEIHKALIKEYEALSKRAIEQKIKLYNGILQQTLADKFIYKFPLPKEPDRLLEPDKPYILSIDGNTIKGRISAILQEKLEVEIQLYENKGRIIPALDIIIDLKVLIDLIDRRIVAIDKEPNKFKTDTAIFLFNPQSNRQVQLYKRQLNHSPRNDNIKLTDQQISAIDASLKQKLTVVWGPPGTGKTITLQGIIAELLSNGQKILFASNTNNAIDGLLKGLIKDSPYKIFDELKSEGKIVRIGSQTNIEVKNNFGTWEVAQYKSNEIRSEIKLLQEKIEKKQTELNSIQDELEQFDYAKYLSEEIKKISEKQKINPSSQKLNDQINYVKHCTEKLLIEIKESENLKDIVLKISSVSENLQNQKSKVVGINSITNKTSAEILEKENELKRIRNEIGVLENKIFGLFRYKNKIKNLKNNETKTANTIAELKTNLETYKKQQTFEIATESQLTGEFVNLLKIISKKVSQLNFVINKTQKYFEALNLVFKLEKQKPQWIVIGEEYKVITESNASNINEFVSLRKVNQKSIAKKYNQVISELEKQIDKNERLQKHYDTKLKNAQRELLKYQNILSKPETYWVEQKEKISQIQKIIKPIITQLNSLNEKLRYLEENVIKEAKLICCTLVKSSYDETLAECEFDTLVVDETSMALLPQLYCTSVLINDRIILCGDHLQLQPISTSQSKVALKWLASSYYDFIEINNEISINKVDKTTDKKKKVQRVIVLKKLNEFQTILSLQHRMPPRVADLIRNWYIKAGNNLKDEYEIPHDFKQFHLNGHFLSENNNVFFLDTSSIRTYHSRSSDKSPYNLINAAIVAEITRELVEDYNIELKNIRCISPYRAQYQLTSSLLYKFLPDEFKEKLSNISSSVHKMQGGEGPIIFYDLTDGSQSGFTFFSKTEEFHIHNVAISRCQFKLIFVGDLKKMQKLPTTNPKAAFNEVLNALLNSAKIIDAKPIKEKIFKQFNENDLIDENALSLTEEQRNSLVILPSIIYYQFLENDIARAKQSILIISPFITKSRWGKLKKSILNFKVETDGTVIIITRPPDKMFGGNQINMAAVEILNEFIQQGFTVKVSPKIHSKLVVIDRGTNNAVAYWGSLNPLSFNNTDEINTRLADIGIAEQLINMSLIGNITPYRKKSLNTQLLKQHAIITVKKQLKEFRWTLAGFYGRPMPAICSNETIDKIIEYLPENRTTYKLIPQFNSRNFILWNHIHEIEEIILPLRELYNGTITGTQLDLFSIE